MKSKYQVSVLMAGLAGASDAGRGALHDNRAPPSGIAMTRSPTPPSVRPPLFALSWRFLLRDWRAGELGLLIAALLVAVAAIAAVGFFVDRMRLALSLEARQLLGADLVVATDRPLEPQWLARAEAGGLTVARTVGFPSMVAAGGRPQLASVKAVSEGYPLRGRLRVAAAAGSPDEPADGVPGRGELWADAQLLQSLGARTGDQVELGESRFTITRVITVEPDRGANFVNFAPRALIRLDELEATGLVQPASRVSWRLLLAGEPAAVAAWEAWFRARGERAARIETLENGRPELRITLERSQRFLSLVALLTALIAAVAVGLAARRFAQRHLDGCAVMRAIGLRQRDLAAILLLELCWIGLAGGVAGALAGWALHFGLVAAVAPLVRLALPEPSAWPALQALAAGAVLLLGFGAWSFLRLAGTPPLRVLRREIGGRTASPWIGALLALVAFSGLLLWLAGDVRLALVALGGFAAAAVVFALAASLAVPIAGALRRRPALLAGSPALRLALASWSRRRTAAIVQTVALAIGMMALMLLTVTRTDLLASWSRASPANAPDRFVINIQPAQRDDVLAALRGAGVARPEVWPMVRGRLVAVNGRPVRPQDYAGDRAQRLLDREFNLSYAAQLPAHNRVIAGRWLDPGAAEVSVEVGILDTLGLTLGDRLAFDIAGREVEARVSSVRKLDWDSMQVNFFMILSPALLESAPQTLITAFREPGGATPVEQALVGRFPNLTIFDTGNLVRQVQAMLSQVVVAIQLLFMLTLAAGVVVLYTALASSRDERLREAALMRALGASRAQLARAQRWELGLSGALAGLLAAAGALATGWVLAARVFQFDYQPRWESLIAGAVAGAVVALAAGWLGLRGVLRSPALASLRE
jgi:putative ABC transport system permease protein